MQRTSIPCGVHFENIVTDSQRFCFGDFGLALSSEFELTEDEVAFLARHRRYDRGRAAVGYGHCLSTAFFGKEHWKESLRTFMKTPPLSVPQAVAATVERQAPLAFAFLEWSRKLREENKQTPYPVEL